MSTPQLGTATGDPDLIARVEPLARAAGLGDRLSVVCIRDGVHRHAHFGAGPATVYEIGSVTKTMTSLLFAEAIETGELRTDTPLGTLLDLDGCSVAEVTLEELAGHRSGLPRVATGLRDRANAIVAVLRHRNPYTADLRRLLIQARAAEVVDRGQFSYSNLGFALLGQALAAHAGVGFPELLQHRLFGRLGMTQSSTPLSSADLPTDAPTGWSARGTREQAWTLGAYAPAGGVRSTAGDMAIYARALLDGAAPGRTALDPRWDADGGSRVGYAWFTDRVADVDIVWHNGATGGFSSMLALDRAGAAAAVILANTAVAVDEIALRLLVDTT
ncbi:serine hydrolase domain-containing protein [Mycolicibacterium sp. 120266]|uniref:serine hydrolase domain-containing protein n=1 Tax=Mycolicibacterium sp. 120266 TaxID=3090601 RepID=UPI00299E1842|nr:serine hydrolase domain-containing protein [Mycolicibacterium sp. 120266]MDX1874623.1 serine hydrolase domain-containing protein [Mycolicibacterium sp. 120266]